MTLYLRILSYIKPYMHRLIFAMFCTIMAAAGNLYIPWIIKDMIDEVLADKNGTMLNWIAASIIAIFVVRGLFWYGQNYLMSYVGQSVIIDIRAAVFKKLQRLSVSFYDKNKTGTIMSYVTNDVNALQSAMVENTIEMITEGFILIGSVVASPGSCAFVVVCHLSMGSFRCQNTRASTGAREPQSLQPD